MWKRGLAGGPKKDKAHLNQKIFLFKKVCVCFFACVVLIYFSQRPSKTGVSLTAFWGMFPNLPSFLVF